MHYATLNSDERPFPFGEWPESDDDDSAPDAEPEPAPAPPKKKMCKRADRAPTLDAFRIVEPDDCQILDVVEYLERLTI